MLKDLFKRKSGQENSKSKSIRTFIMTTDILLNPGDEIHKQIISQIYDYSIELMRKDPVFEKKYGDAKRKNLPHKMGFGMVKDTNSYVPCFIQWQEKDGYPIGEPGINLFIQSGNAMEPKSRASISWVIAVYFE